MFIETPPAPQQVETIIVTASALSSRKDAMNQGVIVLNRETSLIKSMSGGLGETLAGHAGVRSSFYGANSSRPIIRGLGEDRIRLLSNGLQGIDASTISPDHAPAVDGLEAQSIEVLKGASALRFGSNAVGGVVNVIDGRLPTKLRNQGLGGDIFLGASPRDDVKSAAGNISYTKGNFVLRLDGLKRQSGDYSIPGFAQTEDMRAISGDETKGRMFNSGGDIWVKGASLGFVNDNNHAAIAVRETYSIYGIPGEEADVKLKQTRIDFSAAHEFTGSLKSVVFSASQGDYSHAEVAHTGEIGTVFKSNGYDARLEGRLTKIGNFEALFGAQIANKDFEAIGDEAFILPVKIKNNGIFAIGNYETDKWGTQFGLRNDNAKYSGIAGHRVFDGISSSIGGFVKPMIGLRIALTFANTNRIPTETELFANGPHAATQSFEIGDPNLSAENAKSLELATIWKTNTSRIEVNLWQGKFDNFIAFNPTGTIIDNLPVFQTSQRDAELSGYEIVATHNFGEYGNVSFDGNLGIDYVRGKYSNGDNIPRIPPMSVSAGLSANFSGLTIDGNVQVLDSQKKIALFETATKGATIYNIGVGYRPPNNEKWQLRADLHNLTNEEVREHTSVLKDFLPKPGRNFSVSAHYSF